MAENNLFVADASFVLSTLLPDEKMTPLARKNLRLMLDRKNKIVSAHLLEFEIGNGLRTSILRKRIKKESLKVLSKNFNLLPITLTKIDFDKTLLLAVEINLSFYDASYVFLARQLKAKLLTLDEKLPRLAEN